MWLDWIVVIQHGMILTPVQDKFWEEFEEAYSWLVSAHCHLLGGFWREQLGDIGDSNDAVKKYLEVSVLDRGARFDDQREGQVDALVQRVRHLEVGSWTARTVRRRLMRTMRMKMMRTVRRRLMRTMRMKMMMSNDPVCGEESADSGQLERRDGMRRSKVRVGSDGEDFFYFFNTFSHISIGINLIV